MFYNQFWICIPIRSTPCKWTLDDPIFHFYDWVIRFCTSSTYCIYFVYKIIHSVRNHLYKWWTCFHKNFGQQFTSSLFWHLCYTHLLALKLIYVYNQSRPNHVSEIRLVNILTSCHCYIIVGINNFVSFNFKYGDIVISNILYMNKHFLYFFFSYIGL